MDTGRTGVWISARGAGGTDGLPAAAKRAEDLGYGTFWLGGSPPERALGKLLDATETIVCATGILNVWQHTPADVAREHAELTAAHPGRVLLGIGIGHPEATSDYKRPLKTMRDFFAGLNPVPRDERIAAALGIAACEVAPSRPSTPAPPAAVGGPPRWRPIARDQRSRRGYCAGRRVGG